MSREVDEKIDNIIKQARFNPVTKTSWYRGRIKSLLTKATLKERERIETVFCELERVGDSVCKFWLDKARQALKSKEGE